MFIRLHFNYFYAHLDGWLGERLDDWSYWRAVARPKRKLHSVAIGVAPHPTRLFVLF